MLRTAQSLLHILFFTQPNLTTCSSQPLREPFGSPDTCRELQTQWGDEKTRSIQCSALTLLLLGLPLLILAAKLRSMLLPLLPHAPCLMPPLLPSLPPRQALLRTC